MIIYVDYPQCEDIHQGYLKNGHFQEIGSLKLICAIRAMFAKLEKFDTTAFNQYVRT
jgi:hypothetical protein